MIQINGKNYRYGLLDTCILGNILENKQGERVIFIEKFIKSEPLIIPCVSIWSVLELRQKRELYQEFLELFSFIPFSILKTADQILRDEIENYPNPNLVDPLLFSFSFFKKEDESLKNVFSKLFNNPVIIEAEHLWKSKWKKEALDSMLRLKKNFLPQKTNFNSNDTDKFVKEASLQYVIAQNSEWAKRKLRSDALIDINAFPSVKGALYTVFYRFYVAQRNPELQDVFDILINNSVPYMDYVITENFQADILRKVAKNQKAFSHLEIKTIKEIRSKK
jgi:hypothetical protein